VEEALAVLATYGGDARIVAGGQSLAPMMNMRLAQPTCLIDINAIRDLAFVREEDDRLALGALLRHHDLSCHELVRATCPVLAEAAGTIGYYAIRQRGTLGGSLVHADPAAQMPLIAVLLDADFELLSDGDSRRISAQEFFVSVFTTAVAENEILTTIRVPRLSPGEGWGFAMFAAVAGDYAIASAAATLLRDGGGRIARLRLALGSVGPTPVRVDTAHVLGIEPSPEWIRSFAAAAADGLDLDESPKITAEYRRELAAAMIEDALAAAASRSA
jgi:carbon-monoxide dehydrogenase medium subunit